MRRNLWTAWAHGIGGRSVLLRILAAALGAAFAQASIAQERGLAPIVIGQTTSLTGPASAFGVQVSEGLKATIDAVNRRGGVGGQQIKLIVMDDGFDPDRAVKNAERLIGSEGAIALAGVNGAPATAALSSVASERQVPLIGPTQGAPTLRQFHPWRFYLRGSYEDELRLMMRHLAILGIERIAVVYFDNEFGRDGNDRARGMAKAYDSVKLSSVPLRPGPAGVEEAAQKLRTASPQATILYSPVGPAVQLVNRFRHLGGRTTFYGLSVISGDALLAGLGAGASDFVVAQVMPSGTKQGWALVQDCRNALKQSGLEYRGAGQLEGCVIGAVTVEAIRRCGTDVSGRSIARALESKPISLGDFELRFSPSNHNGSQLVDLGLVTREGKITR